MKGIIGLFARSSIPCNAALRDLIPQMSNVRLIRVQRGLSSNLRLKQQTGFHDVRRRGSLYQKRFADGHVDRTAAPERALPNAAPNFTFGFQSRIACPQGFPAASQPFT